MTVANTGPLHANAFFNHKSNFGPHSSVNSLNAGGIIRPQALGNYFDNTQHWKSPGTAYGWNTMLNTTNQPYYSQFDSSGAFAGIDFYSHFIANQSDYYPKAFNRYNHLYHISLYTSLMAFNVQQLINQNISQDGDSIIPVTDNHIANGLTSFTKLLFGGEFLNTSISIEDGLTLLSLIHI